MNEYNYVLRDCERVFVCIMPKKLKLNTSYIILYRNILFRLHNLRNLLFHIMMI